MHVDVTENAEQYETILRISHVEAAYLGRAVYEKAVEIAAHRIADAFVAAHQQDVFAKMDAQAIANLAVAEATNAVRETIHKKLPDVVEVKREVYQRGVFGGLRRVD
jgi:23S rRNA maturation mini-RNase III